MPPLWGSRDIHEAVDYDVEIAEKAKERIINEKGRHATVNETARKLMHDHSQPIGDTGTFVTPWVFNPGLEERGKRVAYQLRSSSSSPDNPEQGEFREIDLVVRVSRRNPINPGALIAREEVASVINSLVVFEAGSRDTDTYTYEEGIGVRTLDLPKHTHGSYFPIGSAIGSQSEHFVDTTDTLELLQQALHN